VHVWAYNRNCFLFVPKNGHISLVSTSILLVHLLLPVEDETRLEFELRGKAWKVYWLLLKQGCPMSVREVQRALRFSSPSVAQHHLERLRELGLVEKQAAGGSYFLASKVKVGVLRHFVKFGRLLFPRYFFYAVFSTTLYVMYLAVFMQGFSRENLFIAFFGAVVSIIFWYEAVRVWSLKPV
jgi:DNA-binding transcriptional ArsR family regulator